MGFRFLSPSHTTQSISKTLQRWHLFDTGTGSCEDGTKRSGSSQRAFFSRQLRQLRLANGRLDRFAGGLAGGGGCCAISCSGLLEERDAEADEEGGFDFAIAKWGRKATVLGGALKSERNGKSQDKGTGNAALMAPMKVRNAKRNGGRWTDNDDKKNETDTTPVGLAEEKKPANLKSYKGLFSLGKSSFCGLHLTSLSDKQLAISGPGSRWCDNTGPCSRGVGAYKNGRTLIVKQQKSKVHCLSPLSFNSRSTP